MQKLTHKQYEDYWLGVHKDTENDLRAVCFPDKPVFFNKFFDDIQKFAVNMFLQREKVDLAGKSVLDIGCGRGRWISFFQDAYKANACGIDFSGEAVDYCKKKGLEAYEESATQLHFEDNTFDMITSITVLLHLPYEIKQQAIAEIKRTLKPGGIAILIENTFDDPAPHVYSQPVSKWAEMFKAEGMDMIHASAHCFNLWRRRLPWFTPFHDNISIFLDSKIEYKLMLEHYNKQSERPMQHMMVFKKP